MSYCFERQNYKNKTREKNRIALPLKNGCAEVQILFFDLFFIAGIYISDYQLYNTKKLNFVNFLIKQQLFFVLLRNYLLNIF
jgi:hypothetical protein